MKNFTYKFFKTFLKEIKRQASNQRNQSTPIPKLPKISNKIATSITNFIPKKINSMSDKENVHPDEKHEENQKIEKNQKISEKNQKIERHEKTEKIQKIEKIEKNQKIEKIEKNSNEPQNFQFKKPEIPEKVFFEDFNEIASEEIEIFEENNDLICDEKIQDIRFKGKPEGFPKEKKQFMPNITEETDEDMSNNCSPNKNEVITVLVNQRKCKFF